VSTEFTLEESERWISNVYTVGRAPSVTAERPEVICIFPT